MPESSSGWTCHTKPLTLAQCLNPLIIWFTKCTVECWQLFFINPRTNQEQQLIHLLEWTAQTGLMHQLLHQTTLHEEGYEKKTKELSNLRKFLTKLGWCFRVLWEHLYQLSIQVHSVTFNHSPPLPRKCLPKSLCFVPRYSHNPSFQTGIEKGFSKLFAGNPKKSKMLQLTCISTNLLVYYCQCHSTHYLFHF